MVVQPLSRVADGEGVAFLSHLAQHAHQCGLHDGGWGCFLILGGGAGPASGDKQTFPRGERAHGRDDARQNRNKVPVRWLEERLAQLQPLLERLAGGLQLVSHGNRDILSPGAGARQLAQRARDQVDGASHGSHARRHVESIPAAGHARVAEHVNEAGVLPQRQTELLWILWTVAKHRGKDPLTKLQHVWGNVKCSSDNAACKCRSILAYHLTNHHLSHTLGSGHIGNPCRRRSASIGPFALLPVKRVKETH
mmetsp:Transcript_12506/g.17058  ORF Transcript_12506/g.17058 Transcript_12506/m.17058 type:complete len:252 (-) Transcript_12506:155-910(-)